MLKSCVTPSATALGRQGITKTFSAVHAYCIGKTTLLHLIAGLEETTSGSVFLSVAALRTERGIMFYTCALQARRRCCV